MANWFPMKSEENDCERGDPTATPAAAAPSTPTAPDASEAELLSSLIITTLTVTWTVTTMQVKGKTTHQQRQFGLQIKMSRFLQLFCLLTSFFHFCCYFFFYFKCSGLHIITVLTLKKEVVRKQTHQQRQLVLQLL